MRTLAEIIPLRTPACREAVDAVAQIAAGETDVEPRAGQHVGSCLRCQAEVAAYRRILRTMSNMRGQDVPLPAGGLVELLRAIEAESQDGSPLASWAVRAAWAGGITAGAAAGVLVWFTRRRPGLPHAS